jgi:Opacity protein and related surface antigens
MKKSLLTASAILIALTSHAHANQFSGVFLGLNLGYSFGEVDIDYEDGTTGNGDFSESEDLDGFEYGGFIGFRHQFPNRLNIGIEGGYMGSSSDGSRQLTVGATNYTYKFEKDNEWYVSLKPGFMAAENTLAYGIIGYHNADFEEELLINGATYGTGDDSFDGYHLGFGVEHMYNNALSARVEYRYNMYNDEDFSGTNGQNLSYDGDESVLRVGVAYNFTGPM